jgi:hypothetical protein
LEAEIEDSFKSLRQMPFQKLHPFDLGSHDIAQLKTHFPEFLRKPNAKRTLANSKGIQITALKALLKEKIQISEDKL